MLEEFGIACCGPFVYPKELRVIARSILPFGMKTVGRFFNVIGPFLAAIPVTVQITGVSDHSVLPTFHELVAEDDSKLYWITSNDLGVDELLSIAPSRAYNSKLKQEFTLDPRELGLGGGSFDDLRPVADLDQTVPHFLALLAGDGPTAAIESIRLNASVLAMNAGVFEDLPPALAASADVIASGEAVRLIERIRAAATAGASAR
jgi:anthranilate phosphoribosyltransferase